MSDATKTFMSIFDLEVEVEENEFIPLKKIVIPSIQRDYVQGRKDPAVTRIRNNFLDAIFLAVTDKPMVLDFVYGDLDDEGNLIPLDGQQRLTTLFLLHWYAAKKENIPPEETEFLERFTYATRLDSREFCRCLLEYQPSFSEKTLAAEIENQYWFPLGWKKDPTINSMLTMLTDIDKKFRPVKNIWQRLREGAISFYFLPIKNMGLSDEIYITMNSRGKPLTDFEHFKALFKNRLDSFDAELSNEFLRKIDLEWTDLIWLYCQNQERLFDTAFMNYMQFLCDILLFRRSETSPGKSRDVFSLVNEIFFGDEENILRSLQFIKDGFDCWLRIKNINSFFYDRMSIGSKVHENLNKSEPGKIIVYFDNPNLFVECMKSYGKNFSLTRTFMLYAFVMYLTHFEEISDKDFRRRIRVVNNLLNNSEIELRQCESTQAGKTRTNNILKQIDEIISHGKISDDLRANFNEYQLAEEKEKLEWTEKNPEQADSLFELEDHCYLYGQIGIVGLENPQNFSKFSALFANKYYEIDRALLSVGNYFQHNKNFYQAGAMMPDSWQNLFHRNKNNEGFEGTKEILNKLLSEHEKLDWELLVKIKNDYLTLCNEEKVFDWRYYYIRYNSFRAGRYGKFYWEDFENKKYSLLICLTSKYLSARAYQPFLRAIVEGKIFEEHYNRDLEHPRLIFGNIQIESTEDGYLATDMETGAEEFRLQVEQVDGVDKEDRVLKFTQSDFWKNILSRKIGAGN